MHEPAEMPARLGAFLAARHPERSGLVVTSYEPMAAGYSRLMARARVRWDGGEEVVVVRGDPPAGTGLIETDRDDEWALLRHLSGHDVPMPAARHYDATGEELGTKAIVLEHVEGPSLLAHLGVVGEAGFGELAQRLATASAAVHGAPPGSLPRPESWESYLDGRIALWREAEVAHVEAEPYVRWVGAWLDAHRPPPAPLTLVHGDFQSANLLVPPGGDLSVVDWEFAHVGDPREDLGWFQAVAAAAPPDLIGFDAEAFCARYRELTGLGEEVVNPVTVGWFSLLGAIQIYANMLRMVATFVHAGSGARGLGVPYNVNSMAFAHMVWLARVRQLEEALS